MKVAMLLLACLTASVAAEQVNQQSQVNPISKVLEMISDLQTKIITEGQQAQKVYEEFAEFCEDRSKELSFEIKTEKGEVADLKAIIAEQSATSESFDTKIQELGGQLATDQADLKAATEIRDFEQADFATEEKDLASVVDTLGRAIGILEKELAKSGGSASMLQIKNAQNVEQALSAMVEASMLRSADESKLQALLQTQQEDGDMGAPDPAVYKGQSGGIVETMQGLFEKAESQLAELRNTEAANIHNFQMLKQSLDDKIRYGEKEMSEAKKGMAEAEEKKATAEGDLAVTSKDLANDIKALAELHADCMSKATDFEDETNSRGEELKALAKAKKIIQESTSGAEDQTYGLNQESMSFVQLRSRSNSHFTAVQFVRDLAKKERSAGLAQLASRMSSAMSFSTRQGEDPFVKVKALVQDMIEKLEAEAEADATKKAYCDKEMAESTEKKEQKEAEIEKLTTSIDSMTSKMAKLDEEIALLQKELAEIAKSQALMDKVRREEKAIYDTNKAEMDKGIKGIKLALKVLTEYYAKDGKDHDAASGAGSGIIGMLEVAESDFTKGLAEMVATEESAKAEYEKETKENEITTTTKRQDVKYKTKESKSLKKATSEAKEDLAGVEEELNAVLEYLDKLKGKCFPIPAESYEERKKRREREIEGLKQGLTILEGEAVLLQTSSTHHLRKRL